jgi:hypothetical protein
MDPERKTTFIHCFTSLRPGTYGTRTLVLMDGWRTYLYVLWSEYFLPLVAQTKDVRTYFRRINYGLVISVDT